jgi:hypothetical protein
MPTAAVSQLTHLPNMVDGYPYRAIQLVRYLDFFLLARTYLRNVYLYQFIPSTNTPVNESNIIYTCTGPFYKIHLAKLATPISKCERFRATITNGRTDFRLKPQFVSGNFPFQKQRSSYDRNPRIAPPTFSTSILQEIHHHTSANHPTSTPKKEEKKTTHKNVSCPHTPPSS